MKRAGPLITLFAGLLLGLFMLSLNATTGEPAPTSLDRSTVSPPASPTPPASPAASPAQPRVPAVRSPSPTPPQDAKYAGRTQDDRASVAITLRKGKAVAYYCDGRTQEAWLRGDVAADGSMRLKSKSGATLDGRVEADRVDGTVTVQDAGHPFTAARAAKPAGVYRATTEVRGTKVDGGWIVLQNGRQVGIVNRDGEPAAAPPIDPRTGAVTIDGEQVTARPVAP
jgi:serine/threonine-protein kinase